MAYRSYAAMLIKTITQAKTWFRYTLMAILSLNAIFALIAFIYASVNAGVFNEECTGNLNDHTKQNETNLSKWGHSSRTNVFSHSDAILCGRRVTSCWLGLLISLFSIVLMISAWLDFREQDLQESVTATSSEESLSEKGLIEFE